MTRDIETWNTSAVSNNFAVPDGAPERHDRSQTNNIVREHMARHAQFYQDGIEFLDLLRDPADRSIVFSVGRTSDTTFEVLSGANDVSSLFNVGRRLRQTTAGNPVGVDVTVLSASYINPTTFVTINPDEVLSAVMDGILLISITSLGRLAFQDTVSGSGYIQPTAFTEAAFDQALVEAASGGCILLGTGTYNLTSEKVLPNRCRLLGMGADSSFLIWTGTDDTSLLSLTTTAGIESLTIIDNGTAGTGARHSIFAASTMSETSIRDVKIENAVGDGIHFVDGGFDCTFDDVTIEEPGGNGITFFDPATVNGRVNKFSKIAVWNPGNGGNVTRYGLDLAGLFHMTDITVRELDGIAPGKPTGIRMKERLAIDPNGQDARDSTIKGVIILGGGANAIGVEMNGRDNALIGGSIRLTGGSSVGVLVEGSLGQQLATRNRVSDIGITAGVGYDETATNGTKNMLSNCHFQDCGVDIRLNSSDGVVQGNSCDGSTVDSIQILATASGNTVSGNTILSTAGNGIEALPGSNLNVVIGNSAVNVVGADYLDSSGTNRFGGNYPRVANTVHREKTGNASTTSSSLVVVSDFTDIPYPTEDGGPNGVRAYLVSTSLITGDTFPDVQQTVLHSGPLGDENDPQIAEVSTGGGGNSFPTLVDIVVPAAGDTVTVSFRRESGTNGSVLVIDESALIIQRIS